MTLFAAASVHGAPGVTTTAMGLAAAWQLATGRDPIVVEADPDGGVLAGRFDELRADRTLADVAVDVRRGFDIERVILSARRVWGAVPVVVAPPSAEQAYSALTTAADRLAVGFAGVTHLDVLVDVGRLTARSPSLPLARRAIVTLLVARPSFEDVAGLTTRTVELAAQGCELGLVVVGDQPYEPAEVAAAAGLELVGVLPDDSRAAAPLTGGPGSDRRLRRSLWWRAITDLASRLATRVPPTAVAAAGEGPDVAALRASNGSRPGDGRSWQDVEQARSEP